VIDYILVRKWDRVVLRGIKVIKSEGYIALQNNAICAFFELTSR